MKKMITFILLLLSITQTGVGQERKSIPAFKDTTLNVTDDEFEELEQKLESEDPTFRFTFSAEKSISYFLAAQNRRPQKFIWIDMISFYFAGDRYDARQLDNKNEQIKLYENAIQYLTESLKTLENVELTDNNDSINTIYNLYLGRLKEEIAIAAVGAERFDLAKKMANDLIDNNIDPTYRNYGVEIYNANIILGLIALRENNLQQAKDFLIKSVEGPQSHQLSFYTVNFDLAKELIELGEHDVVLTYLDQIIGLLANENSRIQNTSIIAINQRNIDQLNLWKEEIKAGKIPNDVQWH